MVIRDTTPFLACIEQFLEFKKNELAIQRGANPELTIKSYNEHLRRFLRWFAVYSGKVSKRIKRADLALNPPQIEENLLLDVIIGEITQKHVQKYLVTAAEAGKSRNTVSVWLYTIKSFYKVMEQISKGRIENVVFQIKRQQFTYEKGPHLKMAHAQKYLAYLEYMPEDDPLKFRNKVLLFTILKFGLRANEALSISEESISFEEDHFILHIEGKRRRKRTLPLPLYENKLSKSGRLVPIATNRRYADLVERFLKSHDGLPYFESVRLSKQSVNSVSNKGNFLFRSRRGVKLSYRQAVDIFKYVMIELGFEIFGYTPHSLRHTAITNSLYSGVDLETASQMYGNSPSTIEKVYSHSEQRKLSDGFSKAF